MRNEFTVIVERSGKGYVATCCEIPEARAEGKSKTEALVVLRVELVQILDGRRDSAVCRAERDAEFETLAID